MNEKLKELADAVGLGIQHGGIVLTKDVNAGIALEQFGKLVAEHCIRLVENMPLHCASTTFQVSIVECAQQQAIDEIRKTFEVNDELVTP